MAKLKLVPKESLYEVDFYAWCHEQAHLIKNKKFTSIDIENIVEELETLGRSDKKALTSAYTVLIMHLLKWQFQPSHQGRSWRLTIKEQRYQVLKLEKDNPSLKAKMPEFLNEIYLEAADLASDETEIPLSEFPAQCPYTFIQLRDFEWMPL